MIVSATRVDFLHDIFFRIPKRLLRSTRVRKYPLWRIPSIRSHSQYSPNNTHPTILTVSFPIVNNAGPHINICTIRDAGTISSTTTALSTNSPPTEATLQVLTLIPTNKTKSCLPRNAHTFFTQSNRYLLRAKAPT